MLQKFIFGGLAVAATVSTALAADLPSTAAPPPPAPAALPAADLSGWSVGGVISTLGAGAELGYRFNPSFGVRGDIVDWPLNIAFTAGNVRYSARVGFLAGSLLGDYYPFGGAFRLTAGARFDLNTFNLVAQSGPITISGFTFTQQQIGTLTSKVTFNPVAPYLGIGVEQPIFADGRVVLTADLGAMYEGTPKVLVAASAGGLAARFLQAETTLVQHYANKLSFYPIVSLGLKYRF